MKFDLEEIGRLNPPGLHNVRPMLFVIEVITALIAKQVAGSPTMLKLVRALGRYHKQAQDDEAYNMAVRIKFWVMEKAERRAWVREIIGETAIRRWQKQYDCLHLPPPHKPMPKPAAQAKMRKPIHMRTKPYVWKRFVMANLSWLELPVFDARSAHNMHAKSKQAGLWQQPRECRGFKPVEFWAFELAEDYQPLESNVQQEAVEPADTQVEVTSNPEPPPKNNTERQNKDPASTSDKPP